METLKKLAQEHSIDLSPEMLSQFEKYYEMLISWNEKVNLTAITDKTEVEIKHFADSILPAGDIPQNATLCDVGTGAGFPGIPLKIARPDLHVTLLDSLNKRVVFLQEVCTVLHLSQTVCLHARAEDAGQGNLRESFDIVTSRAVARLNTPLRIRASACQTGRLFPRVQGELRRGAYRGKKCNSCARRRCGTCG